MSQAPSPSPLNLPPSAHQADYDLGGVNNPIMLYQGDLAFHTASRHLCGCGTVQFQWFPTPRITFGFTQSPVTFLFNPEFDGELRLGDCRVSPASLTMVVAGGGDDRQSSQTVTGRVEAPPASPSPATFSHLTFLLPNFPDAHGSAVVT